ncbi:MAG: calcium-binding protein, partial [Methylococcaceae bacterium]
ENQYQAFAKRAAISFVMQAEADDWLPGAYYSLGQDRFVALDAARLQTHLQERLAAITHPEDANFGALVLARLTSDGVDLAPETMKAALAESPYSSLYSLALDFTGSHVWLLTGNQAAFSAYGNEDWFVLGTPASENLAGGGGEDVLIGAAGNDTLAGNAMADILSGGDGSDVLYGNDDDDVLNGGTGTDSLYGLDGNDVLNGDAGNDWLSGGNGADVYLFYRGSGRDVIDNADSDAPGSNADIVQLGADIAPDDVTLRREGSVLLLDINGSTDRLILSGYFYVNNVTNSALETIQFVDGALWDIATVKAKVLIGGSGNDILSGYASADTLDGGPGNDTLSGDMGADIFLFNRGHGQDTITDYSSNALNGNTDGIQLGTNIAPGDVTLSRVNGDLLLGINNSSDMLWLNGYFASYTASNNALTAIQFADGTVWDNATVKAKVLIGGSGNDTLTGYATADSLFGGTGNDVLYGGDDADVLDGETGNDTLKGEKGADVLLGGAGNDTLDGGNDRDTLDGGSGNDSLYGSHGADVYRFGRGSGHDTIDNFDWDLPGRNADAIQLEDGIVPADVTISRSVNDLLLQISGSDATLWVPRYFELEATTVYAVETIQFTDGTVWNIAAVKAKMLVGGDDYDYFKGYATADILLGGNGGDTLFGGEGADQINGDAGADYLHGENGADTLMGGTGKDILSGGNDNDLLDGGTGNDTLYAGYGADIYLFDRGSGQDTIYNSGSVIVDGKADSIHLGTGIAIHDVTLGRSGNDLLLKITGSDDSLRVQSYFPANGASNHSLETIQFADGTLWDTATIDARALIGDSGSNTLTGYAGADTLNGGDGGDMLYGADGADVLMGGAGKDALYGDNGNDTLDSGAGNDTLRGGDGADVYWFGRGSHQDTLDNADNDVYGSNADTLQLGADLAVGDMLVSRIGDDLLLGIDGTLDLLRVQNYFYQDGASNSGLEAIQFADGTRWDFPTVKTQALTATLGNDVLIGFASADTVAAYDGNDGVYGRDGMDVLDGGSGADTLYGENGADLLTGAVGSDALYGGNDSDTLDGGAGSDLLGGDSGADVYLFGRGAGRDAINNYDGDALGGYVDAIKLGAGIAAADVTLTRVGDDLNLQLKSTDDALLVRNYFYLDGTSAYGLEFIQFADGTVWNYVTAKGKLTTATSTASKTLSGTKKSEKLTGGAGNDLAYGYGGNDTVDGAAGNDTLDGGIGNDIYLFGKGSGKDVINSFDTTVGKKDTILLGAGITAADILPGRNADALVLTITSTGDSIRVNNYFVNDGAGGYQIELVKFADGSSWNVAAVKALALLGTGENDNLTGYAGADTISGLSGDDTLYARAGDDTLYGTAGNDRLYGEDGSDNLQGGTQSDTLSGGNGIDNLQGQEGSDSLYGDVGDDLLDGGAHSDTLDGGPGNDTYLFGRGSGQDTLNSLDNAIGKLDKIQLGTGIAMADVQLGRDNNDLLLAIKGTADGLRVANYLFIEAGGGYQVERIQFADGGLWDIAAIKAKLLEGGNENDTLIGYAGADTLAGAAGNDSLIGGTGDDVLDAGSGNDTLDGGIGNDIYLFGLGAGKDIINNVDNTAGKLDSIQLGDGTSAANVALSRSGNDLWLRINGTTDSLCISNYFVNEAASGFRVEQIRFADGTAWDVAAVKIQVLTGGDEDDALMGYLSSDSISGLAGNDTIKSGVGDDWVDGGDGYDSLYGEDGDDSLLGGKQHDQLWGGNGADTLQEQSGNNQLYGENGNDTLAGGTGMDGLFGGNGADVYRFGRGSGMDTIYNNDTDALGSNADSIWLNAGITAGDLTLSHSNNDLKIQIYGTNDQLVVANYFSMDTTVNYALETIQFADGVVWDMAAVKARLLSPTDGADALVGFAAADSIGGGAGNDRLYGRDGADTLEGDAGSDALYGENGTDLLYGGADNDTLYGGNEGDTLEGGAGNDSLNGDNGADVYLFGRDAGQDTINNSESDVPGVSSDTIQLVGDLAPGDISLARSNDDLLIQINGSDDLLKVSWYFSNWGNSNYLVDNIQFADGMVWNMYSVKDKLSIGTTGNDTIKGFITADTITGGDGNDIITDSNGSDIIDGGTGDDIITDQGGGANTLSGGDGDDIITFSYIANNTIEGGSGHDLIKTDYYGAGYSNIFAGGKGNDRVQSSSNGDTYLFSRGDGQDTINDHSYGNAAADKLVFGAATSSNPPIAFDQLWFRHTGDHLEVTVIGEPDSIVIENWYLGTIYHIEQFQTQDGKTLLDSQVENLVLAMADFALPTETILPQDYQDTLAPILAANWW